MQPNAKNYYENGQSVCPFCGSDEIKKLDVKTEENYLWLERWCLDCDKKWHDEYTTERFLTNFGSDDEAEHSNPNKEDAIVITNSAKFTLQNEVTKKTLDVMVNKEAYGLSIHPNGHDAYDGSAPILLDFFGDSQDNLSLKVWTDPDSEDYTDSISLFPLRKNTENTKEYFDLPVGLTGRPSLFHLKNIFTSYEGEWTNGSEARTGENRNDGTVSYNYEGLYVYEFLNKEDAYGYFFEDKEVPYAVAEYDEDLSELNDEETFGEWECVNGFPEEKLPQN